MALSPYTQRQHTNREWVPKQKAPTRRFFQWLVTTRQGALLLAIGMPIDPIRSNEQTLKTLSQHGSTHTYPPITNVWWVGRIPLYVKPGLLDSGWACWTCGCIQLDRNLYKQIKTPPFSLVIYDQANKGSEAADLVLLETMIGSLSTAMGT